MQKHKAIVSLLICALAMSGCATSGKAAPACPVLPPIPASLTQKTDYVQQVRAELLEPSPPAKPSAMPSLGSRKPTGRR